MRTEKIWDFWASRYESLQVQKYALAPIRKAVLKEIENYLRDRPPAPHARILDMGCGTGQMVQEMEAVLWGYKPVVTGVDLSKAMIDQAFRKNSHAEFICGDAESYAPGCDCYDVIVCLNSFPYYTDQERVLRNFRQMLKDGGLLVLAQASINTIYDKLVMSGVKLTVSHSRYLSFSQMRKLSQKVFVRDPEIGKVPLKWFMPTIGMFIWRNK